MKSAYFWINLPSSSQHPNSQQARQFIAHPPVPDGGTEAGTEAKNSFTPIAWLRDLVRSIVPSDPDIPSSAVPNSAVYKTAKPAQLKMQQYSDSKGHTLWYVYDPIAKQIACIGSMAEVQAWLTKQGDLTRSYDR